MVFLLNVEEDTFGFTILYIKYTIFTKTYEKHTILLLFKNCICGGNSIAS